MDSDELADQLGSAMSNALVLERAVKEHAQRFQLDARELMVEVKKQIAHRVAAKIADSFVGRE